MKREFDARKEAGFDLRIFDKNEIKKEFRFEAAYAVLSKSGATINGYSLTNQLLQYSNRKGLKVYDRTNITSIVYENNKNIAETENGFKIIAENIINASGFEVVNFIKENIVDFYSTYAVISEAQEEKESAWKDRVMMWNTENPYLYLRLTKDNRILIGGRDERFSNTVTRELYLKKKSELLVKDFNKIFPSIVFKKEFSWSGTFGKTKDSLPYIGLYPKTPNTYYAPGFGGNGITFSVIAAEIITDLVKGVKNENAGIFSFNR